MVLLLLELTLEVFQELAKCAFAPSLDGYNAGHASCGQPELCPALL